MYRSRLLALVVLPVCAVAVGLGLPANARQEEKDDRPPTPDPVVVVVPSFAKALEMTPEAYVLSATQYRTLQEELARLRLLVERPAAQTPTKLVLEGKIEHDLVLLTARYKFLATASGTTIRLAGSPAQATGVSLDGIIPRLTAGRPNGKAGEDGFSVHVDKGSDKEQTLTLELVLPLTTRTRQDGGTGREARLVSQGFGLDLPRATITQLAFDLPADVRDVRLGGKPVAGTLKLEDNKLTGPLGAIDRLDLEWKPAAAAATAAVTAAAGTVNVRLDKQQTTTTAKLTLSVLSGQTKTWSLVVPPRAKVAVEPSDKVRVTRIDSSKEKPGLRTIHLEEATSESINVTVTSTDKQAKPGSGAKMPIGPFEVVGAAQQQGSVFVSSSVAEWHVEAEPRGDLTRRAATQTELSNDPALAAAFRYGPGSNDRQTGLPWLDLMVESVSGQLKAKPTYVLVLKPGEEGKGTWQLQAAITVTPRRSGLARFEVALPEGCDLDADSVVLPERGVKDAHPVNKSLITFRLDNADLAAVGPFTVKFEANYRAAGEATTTLALPRLGGTFEQDGIVRLEVPSGVELLPAEKTPGLELVRQSIQSLSYRYPRTPPEGVEARWRPHRPVIRVDSLIDLKLGHGQGQVRHELRYQLPSGTAPQLALRVPEAVSNFRVKKGGQLIDLDRGIAKTSLTPGGDLLELEYEFTLPAAGEPIVVPLAHPETECSGETRVRVWSDAGALPSAPADWLEQNLEEVPDQPSLPVLVLRSPRLGQALTLPVTADDVTSRPLIERALVRVRVADDGEQRFHVSYRLGHLSGRHLDFEMPAPVQRLLRLTCVLDGHEVRPELLAADAGMTGRLIRLRLDPRLIKKPSVLEVSYHLTPVQTALTTTLLPPRVRGESGFPSRWSVLTPENWVILGPEPGPGSPLKWARRDGLYAPTSAVGAAELEAWFGGEAVEAQAAPSLTAWREGEEAVRLTYLPRRSWLLSCSLLVGLGGLVLSRWVLSGKPRRAALAWVLLGLLGLGAMLMLVLMPALAAQIIYGCEPGVAVLLLFIVVQWLLHERSRRKVVFLPSFTRPKSGGSSLSRKELPRHGEPSTVDSLPRTGSSQERSK